MYRRAPGYCNNVELPGAAKYVRHGAVAMVDVLIAAEADGYLKHLPRSRRTEAIEIELKNSIRYGFIVEVPLVDEKVGVPQGTAVSPVEPAPADTMKPSVRYNKGKTLWSLIPKRPLHDIARVFTYGAAKYSDRNWEAPGFDYSSVYDSAMRHLDSWWQGQDIDEESGLPHLAHACANLLFLAQYRYSGYGKDDRKDLTREIGNE